MTKLTAPIPEALSMAEKLNAEHDGPLTFTPDEANALRKMVTDLLEQASVSQGVNRKIAEALYRNGLQLTHHEAKDGSLTFDLQPKGEPTPDDEPTRH